MAAADRSLVPHFVTPRMRSFLSCVAFLLACRGGSATDAEATPPRPAARKAVPGMASGLAFPLDPPPLTALRAEPAFPRLRFERPLLLTHAPGDRERVFVLEQTGRIHRFEARADVETTEIFLDLRDRVRTEHNEEGLLGLAFAPAFERSGVFYVFYSASRPRRSQISRFRVNAEGLGDPTSEQPILLVQQPWGNHNGGTVAFGPDGRLYAGFGDGGMAGDPLQAGQDLGTLLGKIVRLEVEDDGPYRIPSDNPFVGHPEARPEIWAYGLRNPWRFTFDRQTGELWAGDVGQDTLEEIDVIVRGGNYGWSAFEGTRRYRRREVTDAIAPVVEYGRRFGESVTGGYVYRGTALPGFRGAYFYGDYLSGNVWALRRAGTAVESNEIVANIPELTSFGEDANGELHAVSRLGVIHRFVPTETDEGAPRFPTLLSETGLFSDTAALTPAEGLIPYAPTVELWSDGAAKRRWLVLPEGGTIGFAEDGPWSFPVGTVTVKHFELPLDDRDPERTRRLETRVMVHETAGWAGYTYRWNEAETDARLVPSPEVGTFEVVRGGETRAQRWSFPAGSDCLQCHTESYGRVLGIRMRQVRDTVALWRDQGLFAAPPGELAGLPAHPRIDDANAPLEVRARAYLDVNCALCHNPGRPSAAPMDLRIETPLEKMGIVSERPGDAFGLTDEQRVHPGVPGASSIWARMGTLGPQRMPPLASSVIDERGRELVAAWIASLEVTGTR